jgi:DnaK suppressor protein
MTATTPRSFEDQLLRRQAELARHLEAAAAAAVATADEPHDVMDFKDVAAAETLSVVDAVATEQAARELSQVRSALARIDDGSYGFCEDCGDAIDEARLAALPQTPFCTSCQAAREKQAGRA